MNNEGNTQASRSMNLTSSYIPNTELGNIMGAGTYTGALTEPTLQDYENIFGPSARNIKEDMQRYKRHGRWHLPDALRGPNPWLADRIDGLITDATSSPFTSTILPYKYYENVDGKIKWNVWSFDEAMASRVPYEAAARTLTQTKRSFAAYGVRHGLAITMEHNFMMSPKGRENFQNQLTQLIGSIQYSNDLDVHMALVLAPSYEKHMLEKYNNYNRSSSQVVREFVDLFGFMQKNQNALDILIEEAKRKLKLWGGPSPNFMLTNSKLTFQLTMTPEKTNYITQGPDGLKRLKAGPDLASYRGLSIIPSRSFSMEAGQQPRDIMRRRVRVAEYYRITPDQSNPFKTWEFYNEAQDSWFSMSFADIVRCALLPTEDHDYPPPWGQSNMVGAQEELIKPKDLYRKGVTTEQRAKTHRMMLRRYYDYIMGNPVKKSNNSSPANAPPISVPHPEKFEEGGSTIPVRGESSSLPPASDPKPPATKELLSIIDTHFNAHETVAVPISVLVASFATPDTVLAPFVANLHYKSHLDKTRVSNEYQNIPPLMASRAEHCLCTYPRTCKTSYVPQALCSPFTFVQSPHSTLDYHESRVALQRLFSRYAAPCSFLTPGDSHLYFNLQSLSTPHMEVGEMYMQPLGAFYEPNHPLFSENLPEGKNKQVHTGWILTEEVLDYLYNQPHNWETAARIAASVPASNLSKAEYSLNISRSLQTHFEKEGILPLHKTTQKLGAYTWTLQDTYLSSLDYLNPSTELNLNFHSKLRHLSPKGILTNAYLEELIALPNASQHPWMQLISASGTANEQQVLLTLKARLTSDAYAPYISHLSDSIGAERLQQQLLETTIPSCSHHLTHSDFQAHRLGEELECIPKPEVSMPAQITTSPSEKSPELGLDFNIFLGNLDHDFYRPENWEFLIIRPNIEHYMLGVIMGLSGEQLGNTLWGQTELSVYDDSQHGVWGMSYKYHERAIVFNEKNLIRLWDIAYDGYNGGKDDTYVNWTLESEVDEWKGDTLDLTRDYRGKSMLVMAFYISPEARMTEAYKNLYKYNWPSPIVFSGCSNAQAGPENECLIDTKDMIVLHDEIYPMHVWYKDHLAIFRELQRSRKAASTSTQEDETQVDALAFQGSMRVKGMTRLPNNSLIPSIPVTIEGCGHHGPDFVGAASVRAGKGYKMMGGINSLVRQV